MEARKAATQAMGQPLENVAFVVLVDAGTRGLQEDLLHRRIADVMRGARADELADPVHWVVGEPVLLALDEFGRVCGTVLAERVAGLDSLLPEFFAQAVDSAFGQRAHGRGAEAE